MARKRIRPLFIGLPGAGKSTLAAFIGKILSFDVIATDPLFREFRALPANSEDPRAEVMRAFLKTAQEKFPAQAEALAKDAVSVDEKGRCALHDSTRFRGYGEDVFRAFEIEMLRYLDASGAFDGKIVDLSASAPLYAENREIFTRSNFYKTILIDTPFDLIADRLVADYERYVAQSKEAGKEKPIRAAYEKKIDDVLAVASSELTSEARSALIRETVLALTRTESNRCMDAYRAFAAETLVPAATDAMEDLSEKVMMVLGACSML